MNQQNPYQSKETVPQGFDAQGWPLPEVRSMMIDNFTRSWRQHWIAVIVLFAVSVGLVLFGTWLVTPTWEGIGSVEVHPQPMPVISVPGSVVTQAGTLTAQQMVTNMTQQAMSYPLLRDVIEQTKLDEHLRQRNERNDARTRIKKAIVYVASLQFIRGKPTDIDWKVKALDELTTSWLNISSPEGSSVLPLIINGDTPEKTKAVGDAVMDQLQIRMDNALRQQIGKQKELLDQLVVEATQRVADNDRKIEDYRVSLGVFDPAVYAQAAMDSLASLREEQATYQARVSATEAELRLLEEQLQGLPQFATLKREGTRLQPEALTSQRLAIEIAELERERAGKLTRMSPRSAEVVAIDAQLATLRQSLKEAEENESTLTGTSDMDTTGWDPRHLAVYDRWSEVSAQLAALNARAAGIEEAVNVLSESQREAVRADTELRRLQREAAADEDQLKQLTTNAQQLDNLLRQPHLFRGVVQRVDTTVLNERKNDQPSMLLAALIALALGTFAALVLPIAYDYLNQTLLSSRQAATVPGIRVMAFVPRGRPSRMFASA